ncbi:helix-turn-helix transcriptional regulator [uncultured Maritimibacter sp.]|uniref:helix-turn-helix transcriptional regulator n=1 Tax=uncultured Maritimibacter sp. TaxID=991866 RepID=UPI002592CFF2|nr:helix-turn-helix transcriptional regulator [uncultured Maritimibacter sp.]
MPKIDGKDVGFPDRLQRLMDKKSLNQADIARHIWGTVMDERGYTVAKNRQTIGKYLSGKIYPSPPARRKLAEALNVPYGELFPKDDPTAVVGSGIVLHKKGADLYDLEISVSVPLTVATQVIELVKEYAG